MKTDGKIHFLTSKGIEDEKLKSHLKWLVHEARIYGWGGDYIEIGQFVNHVFDRHSEEVPDIIPYPSCDTCDGNGFIVSPKNRMFSCIDCNEKGVIIPETVA